MSKKENRKSRIDFILSHLTRKERDDFLREILDASLTGIEIARIINEWEATAEINANPSLKRKILSRVRQFEQFLIEKNA